MTAYTCGFLFRNDDTEAALIRKTKPKWQAGLLNGIGGHIEPGETPLECQIREFEEETGAVVTDWRRFCVLVLPAACIHFFVSRQEAVIRTTTSETVDWFRRDSLPDTIPNLKWLIPMAADKDRLYVIATETEELNQPFQAVGA